MVVWLVSHFTQSFSLEATFNVYGGTVFFYGRFQLLLVVMGMLSFPMMPVVLFSSGSIYIIYVVT